VNSNSVKWVVEPKFLNGKVDGQVGQAAHEPQEESLPCVVSVATFIKINYVVYNRFGVLRFA
jgi:hypothetical protein